MITAQDINNIIGITESYELPNDWVKEYGTYCYMQWVEAEG